MATVISKGNDLSAFRAAHDRAFIIPERIKKALAALGEAWEYEADFIKRVGTGNHELAAFRDQFADYWVEVRAMGQKNPKRAWSGSKAYMTKMRAMLS